MSTQIEGPKIESLKTLFQNKVFSIPIHQRHYSWVRKQVTELWEDLTRYLKNVKYTSEDVLSQLPTLGYRMGTTTLKRDGSTKKYSVIDGQQRLTTMVIFFKVLADFYEDVALQFKLKNNNMLYSRYLTIANNIRNEFVFSQNGTKLVFRSDNNNFFVKYLRIKLSEKSKCRALAKQVKNISHSNIINCGNTIKRKMQLFIETSSFTQEKFILFLSVLKHTLSSKLYFMVNYQSSNDCSSLIFESYNTRGISITELDKLKNRFVLFSESYGMDLTNEIFECWEYLNITLSKIEDRKKHDVLAIEGGILSIYLMIKRPNILTIDKIDQYGSYNMFIDEFNKEEKNILNENERIERTEMFNNPVENIKVKIKKTLDDLKLIVEFLVCFYNNRISKFCKLQYRRELVELFKKIKFLFNSEKVIFFQGVTPFLIAAYITLANCNVKRMSKQSRTSMMIPLLKLIEVYLFRIRLIKERTTTNTVGLRDLRACTRILYEIHYKEFTNSFIKGEIAKVANRIIDKINENNGEREVKKFFKKRRHSKWDGLRFFLFEYEMHLRNSTSMTVNYDDDSDEEREILDNPNKIHKRISDKDSNFVLKPGGYVIARLLPLHWEEVDGDEVDYEDDYSFSFGSEHTEDIKDNGTPANSIGNLIIAGIGSEDELIDRNSWAIKKASNVFHYSKLKMLNYLQSLKAWTREAMRERRKELFNFCITRWNTKTIVRTINNTTLRKQEDEMNISLDSDKGEGESDSDSDSDEEIVLMRDSERMEDPNIERSQNTQRNTPTLIGDDEYIPTSQRKKKKKKKKKIEKKKKKEVENVRDPRRKKYDPNEDDDALLGGDIFDVDI